MEYPRAAGIGAAPFHFQSFESLRQRFAHHRSRCHVALLSAAALGTGFPGSILRSMRSIIDLWSASPSACNIRFLHRNCRRTTIAIACQSEGTAPLIEPLALQQTHLDTNLTDRYLASPKHPPKELENTKSFWPHNPQRKTEETGALLPAFLRSSWWIEQR
jgi:hypothetical protein